MIQSFANVDTQSIYEGKRVARFANITKVSERKLQQLDIATSLDFLRSPPGNKLERLMGDRSQQYSIRINAQWRICFEWTAKGPESVEIVDYH